MRLTTDYIWLSIESVLSVCGMSQYNKTHCTRTGFLELGNSQVLNMYVITSLHNDCKCMLYATVSHVSGIHIAVHTVLSELLNRACTNEPKADKVVLTFLFRHLN